MPAPVVTPQRTQQSPIKLFTETSYYAPDLRPLQFQYTKVAGTLEGPEFVLDHGGPDCHVVFDGMKCPLRKLHFHTPSEHRVDGRIGGLELHLVHEILEYPEAYPSAFLVIGVMLTPMPDKAGPKLGLDAWLRGHLDPSRSPGHVARTYSVDPTIYLPDERAYFRYEGSLTTGDFDEFVAWVVMRDAKSVVGQGGLEVEDEANRIVQPLMRRYVLRNFQQIA